MNTLPINPDDSIRYELDGIEYLFRQPIGTIELEILKLQDRKTIEAKHFLQAEKETGKIGVEANFDRAAQLAQYDLAANYRASDEAEKNDKIINLACQGWNGGKVPSPEGNNPASYLSIKTKKKLVDWYLKQMELSEDEIKN